MSATFDFGIVESRPIANAGNRIEIITRVASKVAHTKAVRATQVADAGILERQKMLQIGQVLSRRLCVSRAAVLPFKDSSEAAEPRCATVSAIKPPDTSRWSEARPR
jgi:hypothetical protein